jgi:hypothetical protein
LAFFSQLNPVSLSVTVPLLLSVKRGVGKGISPSYPVPAQLMGMLDTSKGSVCQVISTGAGNAGGTAAEIGQGPETSTGPFKRTSTLVAGNGAGRGAAKVIGMGWEAASSNVLWFIRVHNRKPFLPGRLTQFGIRPEKVVKPLPALEPGGSR